MVLVWLNNIGNSLILAWYRYQYQEHTNIPLYWFICIYLIDSDLYLLSVTAGFKSNIGISLALIWILKKGVSVLFAVYLDDCIGISIRISMTISVKAYTCETIDNVQTHRLCLWKCGPWKYLFCLAALLFILGEEICHRAERKKQPTIKTGIIGNMVHHIT